MNNIIAGGRSSAELLGFKEKSDLDEWLRTASKEQMQELHKNCSYRIGSARAGLVINSVLTLALSPSNLVGTAVSAQQLSVARREQRKIEKAAKEYLGVNFRKRPERVARRRHKLAGAAFKTSMAVLLLGQNDVVSLAEAVGGLDLVAPATELEQGVKEGLDVFHGNSVVSAVHSVAEMLAKAAQEFFGIDDKPAWEDLHQAPDAKLAVAAVVGVGAASEANVVMLGADMAGEAAHRRSVQASQHRHADLGEEAAHRQSVQASQHEDEDEDEDEGDSEEESHHHFVKPARLSWLGARMPIFVILAVFILPIVLYLFPKFVVFFPLM